MDVSRFWHFEQTYRLRVYRYIFLKKERENVTFLFPHALAHTLHIYPIQKRKITQIFLTSSISASIIPNAQSDDDLLQEFFIHKNYFFRTMIYFFLCGLYIYFLWLKVSKLQICFFTCMQYQNSRVILETRCIKPCSQSLHKYINYLLEL